MKLFTKQRAARRRLFQLFLVMKLSILMLLAFLQVHAGAYSQKRASLKVENVSLGQVLEQIESKFSFRFFFNNDELLNKPPVTVQLSNATLPEMLGAVLVNTRLDFKILDDRLVIIAPRTEIKEDKQITGQVKDKKGNSIPGASVQIKGTSRGVTTDGQGRFNLKVPGDAVLVISGIGFKRLEAAVAGRTSFDIVLEDDIAGLQEVLVVGYGTQRKVNATGAVDQVSAKVLESRPLSNLGQGLQGLIPNLNINLNNGAPGKGATFNIRGTTSLNGGGPLVLVDGVQMDPNLINPADVESVTVLKDAASAAIYGVRGAFGVILITTKKPQKNSGIHLNYTTSYTLTRPTRMPKYLNGPDYLNMHREADRNGSISGGQTASAPFSALDSTNTANYFKDPANNLPVYVDPANPSKYRYVGNTDWIRVLYPGWAPMMDHNISLSGGEGKTAYVANLGYMQQKGLLKPANQDYRRYNMALKLNTAATEWMDLNLRMNLNRFELNTPNGTQFVDDRVTDWAWIPTDLRPLMPVYHPDGHYSGQGSWTNMIAVIDQNGRVRNSANDLWLTGGIVLKPFKNVRLVGDYTFNTYSYNGTSHYKAFNEYGANGVLLGTYPWTTPSRLRETNSNDQYQALNYYAEYENTFARKHYVKVMLGYNQELKQNKSFNVTTKNLVDPSLPSLTPNNDDRPAVGASAGEWALTGTFFRLNYVFNDKYLLEVNGRYDGTSRFPRGKRYTFLPSVSAGWRISQEGFFDPLKKHISELKLRGSYGTLGNQALSSNYPYLALLPTGTVGHVFNSQTGVYVGTPGLVSPDFTWEKVTSIDGGLDMVMLRDRFSVSFDWYQRTTSGMVRPSASLPAVLGTSAPQRNSADLRTKGWELSLNWKDQLKNDFGYSVKLVMSDYSTRITKYDGNPQKLLSDYYAGANYNDIWGFVTDGFFSTDAEAAATDQSQIWGGKWMAGDIRFKDLDGNKRIDFGKNTADSSGDRRVIGNSTPRYQFGLSLDFNYKGFDLSIFMQGTLKRQVMLGGSYFWGFTDEWSVPMIYHKDYWTPQNTNAYYPRIRFGGGGNYQTQTKYLQNAAYGRMKQITIGYSLPKHLLQRARIQRLRVYVTGQNLFEITKLHKAFDPELLDATTYPLNRAVSFGLQIGL